jgi:hypothetical protein
LEFKNIFKWFIHSISSLFCYYLINGPNLGRRICAEINIYLSSNFIFIWAAGYVLRLICIRWEAQIHLLFFLELLFIMNIRSVPRFILVLQSSCSCINTRVISFPWFYGVAGDLNGGFPIGQVRQHRLMTRNLFAVLDWWSERWTTMNAITTYCVLVWFDTDKFYLTNSINLSNNHHNSNLNTYRLDDIMHPNAVIVIIITLRSCWASVPIDNTRYRLVPVPELLESFALL